MKIKTLNLIAFGKFHNKTIEISDGFNLIYGGNEAGKSTIQHFIEGMLFGFYKPYRKKRTYNDDYYRFKPRQGDRYFGTMIFEDDNGQDIRIERDFLKARDGVRLFDNVTGEDITETYPYDNVTRQYQPLGFGGFSSVMYNNTVNVKQMASKSEEELAREVNDRLVDMATETGDELSVNKVLDYLEGKKKAIGSTGKSKSNYGMTVREKRNLEGILSESEAVYGQIRMNQKRIQQYKRKIEQAQGRSDEYKRRAEAQNAKEQAAMAEKLAAIKAEGDAIEKQLGELGSAEGLDNRVFGQLQVMQSSLDAVGSRIARLTRQMDQIDEDRTDIASRCRRFENSLGGFTQEQIEADYLAYGQVVSQRYIPEQSPEIPGEVQETQAAVKKGTLEDTVSLIGFGHVPLIIGIVLGALFFLFSVINPGSMLPYAGQVILSFMGLLAGLGCAGIMILQNREFKNGEVSPRASAYNEDWDDEDEDWEDQGHAGFFDDLDDEEGFDSDHFSGNTAEQWAMLSDEDDEENLYFDEDGSEGFLEDVQEARVDPGQEILDKYNMADAEAYEAFIVRCREIFERYNKLLLEGDRLNVRMEELEHEKCGLEDERYKYRTAIEDALKQGGVSSIEEYGRACASSAEAEALRAKLSANRRLYDELTQNDFVLASALEEDPVLMTGSHGEEIRAREAVEAFNHEIARIQGENTSLMNGVGNPVEIRERIETLENEIRVYEDEIRACDLAEKFFKSYFRSTHYDNAPNLNQKIGSIIHSITQKYHEVRVDDQLRIRVVDPQSGELLSMDQLSGGTMDQIYLALRFGVAGIVDAGKTMPIILDDPFVQYDDKRKAEAVKYISSLAPDTQVLLFTCTADEKHIMDDNGYRYVGIGI